MTSLFDERNEMTDAEKAAKEHYDSVWEFRRSSDGDDDISKDFLAGVAWHKKHVLEKAKEFMQKDFMISDFVLMKDLEDICK